MEVSRVPPTPLENSHGEPQDSPIPTHLRPVQQEKTLRNDKVPTTETSTLRRGGKFGGPGDDGHFNLLTPAWKPFWLQRIALGIFTAIFLSFAVGITAATRYSATHDGFSEQGNGEWREYAWKFGPTAVLVVVAAFWSRVELQALKYTPWIRLSNCSRQSHIGCECEALLSLDYTHTFSPHALVRSLKRRHWLPALALLVSLLLRVSIALSTSFLTLATRTASAEVPVRILDSFKEVKFETTDPNSDDPNAQTHKFDDYRPFYIGKAIHDLNVSYPFGLNQEMAFQTFEAIKDDKLTGPRLYTSNITIQAVVEGLTVSLDCERSPTCNGPLPPGSRLDRHRLEFPSCDYPVRDPSMRNQLLTSNPYQSETNILWGYTAWSPGAPRHLENCTSLPHQTGFFLLWTAIVNRDVPVDPGLSEGDAYVTAEQHPRKILSCSAVLCAPKITISPVAVTLNGPGVLLETQESLQSRPLLADIEPLVRHATQPMKQYTEEEPGGEGIIGAGGEPTWTAYPYILHAWREAFNTSVSSNVTLGWLENEELELQLKSVFRQMGPAIAHYSLRNSSNTTTVMGKASYQVTKLIVVELAGIVIAVSMGLSTMLALALLCFFVPSHAISTRDPGVLLGMATLLDHQFVKLYPPRPKLDRDPIFRPFRIPDYILRTPISSEIPWIIRPYVVGLVVITVTALVVSFAILLAVSNYGGIAIVDIDSNPQLIYLWTILPATVLLSLSLYTTACNGLFRTLGAITQIATPSPPTALELSWVDIFGLQVLWRALRTSRFHLASSEMLTIAANLLTVFSTLMYKPDQVTVVRGAVDLEPTTWFAVRAESERPKVGELIQQGRHEEIYDSPEYELSLRIGSMFNFNRTSSDLQFPSGTFGSFVLPSFADLDDNTINPDSTVIVDTKVLHLKSDCYEIATSEFTLVLEENTIDNRMSPDKPKRFDMKITHQSFTCPRNVGQAQWNFTHTLEGTGPSFYFADRIWIAEICDNSTEDWMRHEATSSKRWLWGYTSDLGAKGIEFFSVWHCDYSWEAVDANLTLRARDLSVDTSVHKDPDAAFDTSAGRPWDPPIPLPRIDDEVEYTGYDIANRGSIKINDFNIPIYPDPFFKAVDKPYADLISWFRILLPPYGLLDQADLEGPEGKERVMDALNSNYRFIAAQYANLFNRLDLNRISKDIPIRPPQGLKKPVSAQVKIQVWQLYQKAVPSFIVIGILSLILVANVRGLVILLWRQRGRRGKKNSWIEGTDFPSFVPRGPNSVATGARLWAESNVKQWLPADADRMRPKELHELLRGTTFKLGWFRRKGGSRDRVFTIGVLDPEYWSEADDDESLDLR